MTKFKLASAGAIAIAAVLAFGTAASAGTVVLSDNFDNATAGLNSAGDSVFTSTSPLENSPNAASIDIIGAGAGFDLLPGHGLYVDLDGSSGSGNTPVFGQLTSTATFGPGAYTLTFDLAGNQRGAAAQTTTVTFGGLSYTISDVASSQGFTPYSFTFNTTSDAQLMIVETGGPAGSDQQGNLLDNVMLVSNVPEPAAWGMMIGGLGLIGLSLRRRNQMAAGSIA
jgi:hypothetical protein